MTLELEVIIFRQQPAKEKNCNNQLLEYINYCTEININLLLNTCNFWFVFSLILSENTQNVHLEKLNFEISRGSMPPDSPSVLAPSALDPALAGLTLTNPELLLPGLLYTNG